MNDGEFDNSEQYYASLFFSNIEKIDIRIILTAILELGCKYGCEDPTRVIEEILESQGLDIMCQPIQNISD